LSVGKQFGKLFDELEIENPNGKFWMFVNGMADIVGFLAKIIGEPARAKKVATDEGLFSIFGGWDSFTRAIRDGFNSRPGTQGGIGIQSMGAMPRMGTTNITINGAIDPGATARAVSNALNYAPLRGVSTTQIRPV
jgi:hypothetical protein